MTKRHHIIRLGTSVVALAVTGAAHAQGVTAAPAGTQSPATQVAPTASAQEDANASSSAAGDIVVTANKREQNLSKVGSSIAAFGAEQLAARRVETVADLAQVTPGLTFAPTPTATPVYTLRGVGFFDSTLAAYPDVSIYIDQVPLSLPVMSTLTAFDLERVEVLKGPQGTLFGNNATGGAINLVAAKPTSTPHAGFELGYGRYNTLDASGYVSGPLTDTLSGRVAFKSEISENGWQHSYTSTDTLGQKNNQAGRILLDWNPTSTLKFELNVNGWINKDDPQAPQKIANSPQNAAPANFPELLYPTAPHNDAAAGWGPNRPYADTTFWQTALRTDYDAGFATLTSLTSFSKTRFLNATEGGGTPFADLDLDQDRGHLKSFTQELRLANGAGHRFRWVVGGNYERTTVDELTDLTYSDTTSTLVNGIVNSVYYSDQKMRNYAGFANGEFDVSDQLTFKAGVRQSHTERSIYTTNGDNPDFPQAINPNTGLQGTSLTNFFNAVYGAIYGGAVPTIAPYGNIVLDNRTNANGTPVNPATYLTTDPVVESIKENSTSWSAGVNYKPVSDLLLYANVSRGYKAGSFPHLSGSVYIAYEPVKQEQLTDYEAGFKLQAFDHKLSFTGAGFYYDYRNKQLRAKFVDPLFGALDLLVNVPKSRIYGAEASVDARPIHGLDLSASATYLNATVRDYTGVVGSVLTSNGTLAPVNASFAGVALPHAPKLQYSVRADYDTPISSKVNLFFGVGLNGQTSSQSTLSLAGDKAFGVPSSLYKINSYSLVDANIGIHAADNSWRVTVWGKNVFNKYYWTNDIQAYDDVVRYTGLPANYGVTAGFKF